MPATIQTAATATIEAGKADGQLPKFAIHGYTGGQMKLAGWRYPTVLDLEGLQAARQDIPALRQHSDESIVGHSTSVEINADGVFIEGVISGTGAAAAEVVANAKNGFGWQASVGADPGKVEHLAAGKTINVNGRSFVGPMHIVRSAVISEISFVPRGADSATSAAIAAQETSMELETDPDTLERDRYRGIKAAFQPQWDSLQANGINPDEMFDRAVNEKWTVPRAELEVERASRPRASMGNSRGIAAASSQSVIEAAMCQALNLPNLDKVYSDEQLQSAHSAFHGRMGIQQLLLMGASANGYVVPAGSRITAGNLREVLLHAMPATGVRATGFSTFSTPGILSTTANRAAAAGYEEADSTWRQIAQIKSVDDFRGVSTLRLLDNLDYDEIGPDGEFKHGDISEETYERRAKTYGRMFAFTRTDIINDDLGLFDDMKKRLGLAGGVKVSDVAWAAFLNNATFFTAGHLNYDEDTDTALGTDGAALALAEILFSKLKSPDGKIIGGDASNLVIPPELAVKARMLYGETNAGSVIADDTIATAFRAMYRPVKQARLSDSAYPGYSATAWYLLRDPRVAAVVALSFLNGRQTPIVEEAQADFHQLGIQMRTYHDFGVDLTNDYVAGVKMEGVNV